MTGATCAHDALVDRRLREREPAEVVARRSARSRQSVSATHAHAERAASVSTAIAPDPGRRALAADRLGALAVDEQRLRRCPRAAAAPTRGSSPCSASTSPARASCGSATAAHSASSSSSRSSNRSTGRRSAIVTRSCVERYWWTSDTAIEPSPTALATRLIERARTSPATNTPGTLVSSRYGSRVERPARGLGVGPGEDEAALVARDDAVEPVGPRRGADEHEAGVGVEHLARSPSASRTRSRAQVAVLALGGDRLRARADVDVARARRSARSGSATSTSPASTAHEHRHLAGVAGEVHGGLAGRVGAADDHDVLVRARARLGHRRAVVDAGAGQLGEARARRAGGRRRRRRRARSSRSACRRR